MQTNAFRRKMHTVRVTEEELCDLKFVAAENHRTTSAQVRYWIAQESQELRRAARERGHGSATGTAEKRLG